MRHIYNKGDFRNGEWAKHLRPYGKKLGNRKWRKTVKENVDEELIQNTTPDKSTLNYHKKRQIIAKYTIVFFNTKWTRVKKYRKLRDAKNVMNRPNVINFSIIKGEKETT